MWTTDVVKSRWLEAAETERRLPLGQRPQASGFWPKYQHTFEEMAGWGSQRLAEEREMFVRRIPPSASAISRYLEVLKWSAELIQGDHDQKEQRRRLVWAWAFCHAYRKSFSEYCRKRGLVKLTAYRRLNATFSQISSELCKNGALLRGSEQMFLVTTSASDGSSSPTLSTPDDEPDAHPTFQVFDGDRPGHLLTSPQAVEAFEKFLAKTNKRRRKEQERRRKLGILEEDAA